MQSPHNLTHGAASAPRSIVSPYPTLAASLTMTAPRQRPNVPLNQLASGRAQRLLAIVDSWLRDVREHAIEPEGPEADEEADNQ
jgi:hypothetical protein